MSIYEKFTRQTGCDFNAAICITNTTYPK